MPIQLSNQEAKRIAIRAQGLDSGRLDRTVTKADISKSIRAMGVLQIDSVNVCVRTHYMPMFSRLGSYDQGLLEELAYDDKDLFETWAHEACFVPIEDHAWFRPRMAEFRPWKRIQQLTEENPEFLESAYEQVIANGPMTASELDGAGKRQGPWWGYNHGKIAMEWFFGRGDFSVATRKNFTRYYDISERVIPEQHFNGFAPTIDDSRYEWLKKASIAHGVGTAPDLADYFRVKNPVARPILDRLVADREVQIASVEGWNEPAYVPSKLMSAEPVKGRTLLTPFDPLVWNRDRIKRIFDFDYKIEIYVPEKKRKYGYYVYPFLLGEDLVGRVDLKAERDKSVLRVKGAFVEEGFDHEYVAENLADELKLMAGWLGLKRVVAGRRGNLVGELRTALKR
jgi:uncharacterized protein YcaQ